MDRFDPDKAGIGEPHPRLQQQVREDDAGIIKSMDPRSALSSLGHLSYSPHGGNDDFTTDCGDPSCRSENGTHYASWTEKGGAWVWVCRRNNDHKGTLIDFLMMALRVDLAAAFKRARELLGLDGQQSRNGNRNIKAERDTTTENGSNERTGPKDKRSVADILVGYAEACDLFVDAENPDSVYADIHIDGHRETHNVESKTYRDWLRNEHYLCTSKTARSADIAQAVETIVGRTRMTRPLVKRPVFIRCARQDGKLYLDRGSDDCSAYCITEDGWTLEAASPVRFRRDATTLPLPIAVRGGKLNPLREVLNVDDEEFVLAISWVLHGLTAKPPFTLLVFQGEQGTGKSMCSRTVRSLIDPSSSDLRSPPRSESDLYVAAQGTYVLAYDNLSGLPPWLSDALCRVGGTQSYSKKKNYTDADDFLMKGGRLILINGIDEAVTRGDLADRALFLYLQPIKKRATEEQLAAHREAAWPEALGALLDAACEGLRNLPTTHLDNPPRMADFARWVTACEPALWPAGTFMKAYLANRAKSALGVLAADLVGNELRDWFPSQVFGWRGTPTEFFNALSSHHTARVGLGGFPARGWPATPAALTNAIVRIAEPLRQAGISFDNGAGHVSRWIAFSHVPATTATTHSPLLTNKEERRGGERAAEEKPVPPPTSSRSSRSSPNGAAKKGGGLWDQQRLPASVDDSEDL